MVFLWFTYGLPEGITHQHSDFFMAQLAAAMLQHLAEYGEGARLGQQLRNHLRIEIREMGEQWEEKSPKHAKSTTYVNK